MGRGSILTLVSKPLASFLRGSSYRSLIGFLFCLFWDCSKSIVLLYCEYTRILRSAVEQDTSWLRKRRDDSFKSLRKRLIDHDFAFVQDTMQVFFDDATISISYQMKITYQESYALKIFCTI